MINGVNNQNISPGMTEESIAASAAMIVTGLEKELKTHKVNTDLKPSEVDLKKIDEYIQKLNDASSLDRIRKYEEKRQKEQKKKEELARGRRFNIADLYIKAALPFEWVKKRISDTIFDFLFDIESRILREILKFVLKPNIEDLLGLASELNIDLSAWKLDKISIDHQGDILLAGDLSPEERVRILLLDECKILEIGLLFADSWFKKAVIKFRLFRVKATLKELGVTQEEFDFISLSAKRIAFLKIISMLKDHHLKRVLSSSQREFKDYSRLINSLTKKIRKIDIDLPQKGMEWIHKKLGTMALEAARYKLELLRSMQTLGRDAERAKTIKWLESTTLHLKHA